MTQLIQIFKIKLFFTKVVNNSGNIKVSSKKNNNGYNNNNGDKRSRRKSRKSKSRNLTKSKKITRNNIIKTGPSFLIFAIKEVFN